MRRKWQNLSLSDITTKIAHQEAFIYTARRHDTATYHTAHRLASAACAARRVASCKSCVSTASFGSCT